MKHAIVATLALAAGLSITVGAQQPSSPFRSGIEAVYLDVTVTEPSGAIVTGLTKDDFQIFDEDVPHEVALFSDKPSPISVAVLIDASKSMEKARIVAALTGARALGRTLQPQDLWSIFTFNTRLHEIIKWRPFDNGALDAIKEISTEGGTEMFKSIENLVGKIRDTPHRKRAILLISDGVDNAAQAGRGSASTRITEIPQVYDYRGNAERALRSGEVMLYAIGIGAVNGRIGIDAPALRKLAEPTGGGVALAMNTADVEVAASRLAHELRQQYTLGFYPQKAPDGKYRRIKVTAKNPDYRVRTRAGYLATKPK